jgi:hypothetical protein
MANENSPKLGQIKLHSSAQAPRRGLPHEARWTIIGLLLLLFLSLLFLNLVPRETFERWAGTGIITGAVVDARNQPAQATVLIVKSDLETTTDAQGRFELRGVPAGERQVVVGLTVSGVEYRVQVVAGQVTDVGQLRAPLEDKGQ